MGQYFLIANHKRKEYIHPHAFEDGAKIREFGMGGRTMFALTMLLSTEGDGRSVIGSWCGDPVGIHGDYAADYVYERCRTEGEYRDISEDIMKAILVDYPSYRERFEAIVLGDRVPQGVRALLGKKEGG